MGALYLCDRCGREIKPTGLLNLMKGKAYYTKLDYIPSILDEKVWGIGHSKILCDDCGMSFSKWWTEPTSRKEEANGS